mgnify:CR=1 FL=1
MELQLRVRCIRILPVLYCLIMSNLCCLQTKLMLIGHSSGAHLCAFAMIELMRDGLGLSSAESLLPVSISGIQFSDRHFDYSRNGNSDNDDRHSTGSSGSFYVINSQSDNGAQSTGHRSSHSGSPVLTADLVMTQKSETEMSEASMLESELRELTQGGTGELQYPGVAVPESTVEGASAEGTSPKRQESEQADNGDGEDADDEDDNNSIVTVKQTEGGDLPNVFDTQPTRTELCRSLKAVIGEYF